MVKEKIYRSGILPYIISDDEIQILFMKPSDPKYGGDAFQMAKGKHEEGETPLETAVREGGEELGLFQHNIEQTYDLGTMLGRTHVYVVKIKDPSLFGDPHFETAETKWMTPDMFYQWGRRLHAPVVKAAVRRIKQEEKSNATPERG